MLPLINASKQNFSLFQKWVIQIVSTLCYLMYWCPVHWTLAYFVRLYGPDLLFGQFWFNRSACLINNRFTCLAQSIPIKQGVNSTVILPLTKYECSLLALLIPNSLLTKPEAFSKSFLQSASCSNMLSWLSVIPCLNSPLTYWKGKVS